MDYFDILGARKKQKNIDEYKELLEAYQKKYELLQEKADALGKEQESAHNLAGNIRSCVRGFSNEPESHKKDAEKILSEKADYEREYKNIKNSDKKSKRIAFATVAAGMGAALSGGPIGMGLGSAAIAGILVSEKKRNAKITAKAEGQTEELKKKIEQINEIIGEKDGEEGLMGLTLEYVRNVMGVLRETGQ